MRLIFVTTLLLAAVTAASAQQTTDKTKKPNLLTLSGCVSQGDGGTTVFTTADDASTYRLTGKKVRDYVGKRVEIVGDQPLAIKGGLFPTPNVAAQAGAIDPSRAATIAASTPGGTNANTPLPEFRVRSVRPVSGTCEAK